MRDLRGRDLAMVFQDPMTSLNPVITIEEQLVEVIRAHDSKVTKAAAHQRALDLLELVGIPNAKERLRGLCPPAQRRDAPAGDDRDRPRPATPS